MFEKERAPVHKETRESSQCFPPEQHTKVFASSVWSAFLECRTSYVSVCVSVRRASVLVTPRRRRGEGPRPPPPPPPYPRCRAPGSRWTRAACARPCACRTPSLGSWTCLRLSARAAAPRLVFQILILMLLIKACESRHHDCMGKRGCGFWRGGRLALFVRVGRLARHRLTPRPA